VKAMLPGKTQPVGEMNIHSTLPLPLRVHISPFFMKTCHPMLVPTEEDIKDLMKISTLRKKLHLIRKAPLGFSKL
jgi:hypothetical protein